MRRSKACDCGQKLLWARTERYRWIPLNPVPDPGGNQAVWLDPDGIVHTRQIPPGDRPYDFEDLHMPHFATCVLRRPAPAPQQAPAALPAKVTLFDPAWRAKRGTDGRP
jgi:hypothetical protein